MAVFIKDGYPVEQNRDGGDSAMRAGMLTLLDYSGFSSNKLSEYVLYNGNCVRHPKQIPWNNPKNFTRDQMIPLLAGLYKHNFTGLLRQIFKATSKRFFFAQNSERDMFGSKKYPFPHYFYKDSFPNSKTFFYWNTKPTYTDRIERRWFDWADPLLPQHVWCLIKAAKIHYLYPIALIGVPCHLVSLILHSFSKSKYEENQMIAECYIIGTLPLYKLLNKSWIETSRKYWGDRNELEYHTMLENFINKI